MIVFFPDSSHVCIFEFFYSIDSLNMLIGNVHVALSILTSYTYMYMQTVDLMRNNLIDVFEGLH